jgi:hypothetical protein
MHPKLMESTHLDLEYEKTDPQLAIGSAETELSYKEQAFLAGYLQSFNGTQTMIDIGVTTNRNYARNAASEMLARPHVKAVIQSYLETEQASANEVIARLSYIAREGDLSHFLEIDEKGPKLNLDTPKAREALGLIRKVKHKSTIREDPQTKERIYESEIELEVYSKLDALSILSRHYDKVALPGNDEDDPIAAAKPLYIVVKPTQDEQEQEQEQETD